MKNIFFSTLLLVTTSLASYGQDNYLEKGNVFLNNGKFEKAEKTFKEGIKSDPTNLIYQCQLGLALIEQKKYSEAEIILEKILKSDSNHIGAIWYSGIGYFKSGQDRMAIGRFEKALTLLNKKSGQYYGANWFIGKCYSILLKTEGLSYGETDRMFECYEEYLRLQPNAENAAEIREYVERKKKRRPPSNVLKWVDL
jgi:tetratricopeptide (TPR) repeat protein